MIHQHELRIGNCIKDSRGKVRFVSAQIIYDIEKYPGHHGYEPIELNEERLKQFGFKKGNDSLGDFEEMWEDDNGNRIDKEKGEYKWWLVDRYSDYVKLKNIHQLQNLYYAIEGKELEVHNLK